MSQAISALSVGTEVNLVETRSGTRYLTPYIIIATGSGNPYGSDKVLVVRKRYYASSVKFGNTPLYDGSNIDSYLTNTYMSVFDAATKNCIALSTIKCYNISTDEQYTLARKAFLLSNKEVGGTDSHDKSTAIPYFNSNSRRIAYDNSGVTAASWWLRSPYSSSNVWNVFSRGTISNDNATNSYAARPALNIISSTPVSSVANQDGSYNLLPSVGIAAGSDNTGASDPVVDVITFLAQYNAVGTYTFTYTADGWTIDGDENAYSASDLETTFGITYTGTAAVSDTIVASIVNPIKRLEYTCLLGGTNKRPSEAALELEYTCQGDNITTYLCNNYKDDSPTWEEVSVGVAHTFTNRTHGGVSISVGSGNTGVDSAIVDRTTFLSTKNVAGTYTFTYNGTNWILDGNAVNLSSFGITCTGTPAENDTVIVTLTQWFVGAKIVAQSENTITSYEPLVKLITD